MRLLTKEDVVGIFPPLCSPFDKNEDLDLRLLRQEVQFNLSLGVTGVCIGGSTGEGHALEGHEIGEMVKVAQEEVAGRIPVIAGIITTSTREAVKRAKIARDAGAQAVMVTPPIYQICSDDGMYDFYSTIHKESGLPIIVYNVLTNAPVTPHLMQRMAANLDETGLIATKKASAARSRLWASCSKPSATRSQSPGRMTGSSILVSRSVRPARFRAPAPSCRATPWCCGRLCSAATSPQRRRCTSLSPTCAARSAAITGRPA